MAIHNKSHSNSGLMSINRMNRESIGHEKEGVYVPEKTDCVFLIKDCLEVLKAIPDDSVDLILIDPPYNLDITVWDTYSDYMEWASDWINEAYRVLSKTGNMIIFGGTQFRDARSGDLIEIIYYCRHMTKFRLINTIVWYYKNGMSAHRYFANRHEEIIWLAKTNKYYFDLDSVRVKYNEKDLEIALRDKRLIPENVLKGKNPTNVWEIGRLNGNSKERVGHPTQKPVEIIRRLVVSLSYPGATVLDFFAGSGTTGRVCIEEKRNCIMCDTDSACRDYFDRHIKNMKSMGETNRFEIDDSLETFFKNVSASVNANR